MAVAGNRAGIAMEPNGITPFRGVLARETGDMAASGGIACLCGGAVMIPGRWGFTVAGVAGSRVLGRSPLRAHYTQRSWP